MVKKASKNPPLDPVGYDINTDPKRWQRLTDWRVVVEMIGTDGQDTVTGTTAIPPVQHGVLFDKFTPNAEWTKLITQLFHTKPVFASFGYPSAKNVAHFVGDGQAVEHGSDVTVHIDRDLKSKEISVGLAILPDQNLMFPAADVGTWGGDNLNYLGNAHINVPTPNDPEFPLPATGTVLVIDSTKTPIDGVDGGTFRMRVMPVSGFYITLESAGCVDQNNVRQHVITPDPKMPDILVRMATLGLTPEEDKALTREVKLTVSYSEGNRKDKTVFTDTVTGPEWHPDWGGKFYGGDIAVEVTATLPWGEKVTSKLAKGTHVIRGKNPARALIHGALGTDLYTLVIGYQESKFAQFGVKATQTFHPEPLEPLRDAANGFGIGALTNLPPKLPHVHISKSVDGPTIEALWNWKNNAAVTVQYAAMCRAKAVKYASDQYKKYPAARKLTENEIDEIGWQLYHRGYSSTFYWQYDDKSKKSDWVAHPLDGYVDDCVKWREAVKANKPPDGWN